MKTAIQIPSSSVIDIMKFAIVLTVLMAVCVSADRDYFGQSTGSGSGNTIGSHNAQSG